MGRGNTFAGNGSDGVAVRVALGHSACRAEGRQTRNTQMRSGGLVGSGPGGYFSVLPRPGPRLVFSSGVRYACLCPIMNHFRTSLNVFGTGPMGDQIR